MKRTYWWMVLILALAMSTGCATKTEYGECIGLNGTPDPALKYEYSGWNLLVGAVFLETIIVPIVVVLDDAKCPTGKAVSK